MLDETGFLWLVVGLALAAAYWKVVVCAVVLWVLIKFVTTQMSDKDTSEDVR